MLSSLSGRGYPRQPQQAQARFSAMVQFGQFDCSCTVLERGTDLDIQGKEPVKRSLAYLALAFPQSKTAKTEAKIKLPRQAKHKFYNPC